MRGETSNSKKITFSAPAKIHLLGEHAVVYGKPAIISATNLRLTLTLSLVILPARQNFSGGGSEAKNLLN